MPDRAILVTGAAGFIGFHVAQRFLQSGQRVVGIDNLNSYYDPQLKLARLDIGDRPTAAHAMELAAPLITAYEAGELASVDIVYANFKSALSTPPAILRVLPVETDSRTAGQPDNKKPGTTASYILKPGAEEILSQLLPLYVKNQFYRALVETAASEQGARRTAMKNATDNATEILGKLTITYNRARQAQITQELAEIVGGAAALAG